MHEFPGSSPLSFVGRGLAAPLQQNQQQNQQQYQPQKAPVIELTEASETNAERIYRDAANFCEVTTPIALGSAVVFAFHSLQVAGGSIFAIGLYQIYLGAKLSNPHRRWITAIVGLGTTAGMIAASAEPIGEWQQQQQTQARVTTGIRELRVTPKSTNLPLEYFPPIALAVIILALTFKGKKQ